ncbi:MAG: hypothetical protein IPP37_08020 [Saprospiraceae bacterium]|nr:hypothetical protein [Saprospiraceae bacterium]
MKFRLTLILSFCFGFLLGQSDGMKTEYIGRKGYKEQIRENINRFNAENGITSKNRNKMNYDAYMKQKPLIRKPVMHMGFSMVIGPTIPYYKALREWAG